MREKYFAGFQLAALHTFPITLALCVGAALLQLGLTYLQAPDSTGFLEVMDTGMDSIFRSGLGLVGAMALMPLRGKSSYCYFLRRLQLPSSHIGFLWSANALCCLLLFWGSQIVVLWGCSALTQSMLPVETWSHQTFFIDCYRSDILRSILPMGDWVVWVRNLLSLVAIALTSGFTVVTAWQGGQGKMASFNIIMVLISCVSSGSALDYLLIAFFAIIALVSAVAIVNAEEDTQ